MNNEAFERIPATPPKIESLPPEAQRLIWSVMIPTYNCSEYLIETIKSVLKQDPGPEYMQIEVVDDCSTDADVKLLVKNIGNGRVSYFRQSGNVGSVRNFETCINRARGKYIHLLHGDDRVLDGFYKNISTLFQKYPDAGAAFCRWQYINEEGSVMRFAKKEIENSGIVKQALYELGVSQLTQYVATVVKREVYEKLGGFFAVKYGEDWEMWARIAKHYSMAYTPEILAEYREHNNSISSYSFGNAENFKDINKVIKIINGYLPKKVRRYSYNEAKKNYAAWVLQQLSLLPKNSVNNKIINRQLMEIFWFCRDIRVMGIAIGLKLRMFADSFKYYFKKR